MAGPVRSSTPFDFAPSGFFVFRTPLLPFEEVEQWSSGLAAPAAAAAAASSADPEPLAAALAADRAALRARLNALLERPEVQEALFVASPSLADALETWRREPDGKKGQRAERALVRYFLRMAARATPFGLFSGCSTALLAAGTPAEPGAAAGSPGEPVAVAPAMPAEPGAAAGSRTRLTLEPRAAYRRHTRLDMDYLFALCEELERDAGLRRELRYRPNSSLYRAAGRLRYAEARLEDKVRSHHLVAVEASDYLEATLARASGGARAAELAAALVTATTSDAPDGPATSNAPDEPETSKASAGPETPRAPDGPATSEAVDADAADADADPELAISQEDADAFLTELIDSQVLVSDLSPPVTGPEAIHDLVDHLAGLDAGQQAAQRLAAARDALAALDSGGVGAPAERYRAIAADLEALPAKVEMARLFQVDMVKPPAEANLGPEVVAEIVRGVDLVRRLSPRMRYESLERFRKDFQERYGEQREAPLVEVLDEEIGIGFERSSEVGAEASPLLRGLALSPPAADPSVPWGPRQSVLLAKLQEALAGGSQQIELTAEELDRMAPADAGEPQAFPDAFQVIVTLAAASPQALDRGEFQLLMGSAGGPSGARLLGRFCHADELLCDQTRRHLRAEEALHPAAVFAEIVHLPQGRIGNILSRPVLRDYEIPFLGRSGSPDENQIPVTDLLVSVLGDRIVLRSRRLGREVIPRLTSAHNFSMRSLGIYRFLCTLQSQEMLGGVGFSWGPLDSAPFVPRLTHGRLVLTRAGWWMTGEEIKKLAKAVGTARYAAVQEWRHRRRLPRLVTLADGDNELLVDLDNALSIDAFLDVIEERDRARLQEMFPGPEALIARGPEGRFVHELVVPFHRLPRPAAAVPATVAAGAGAGEAAVDAGSAPAAVMAATGEAAAAAVAAGAGGNGLAGRRSFPPGSEWLFAKLYTGTATADRVLRGVLAPLVQEALAAGWIDSWFFIRYGDPEWHIRVRFHGDPAILAGRVLPALHAAVAPLLDDGQLWKLQLDTYEREVERYGGPLGVGLVERLFQADSEAVLEILGMLEGDEGADVRWRLAFYGVDALLNDLGLDAEAKLQVLSRMRQGFAREFAGPADGQGKNAKALQVQLDQKFRTERPKLEPLLQAAGDSGNDLAPALDVFGHRSRALAPIVAELRGLEQAGKLLGTVGDMAVSLAHMHVNRFIRSAARAHEMVLYDFLFQTHRSRAARARKHAPAPAAG
ncbi:MAG: lantibiotic dehydratase [Acidobacteria bacterium]|nr:lantibiotic dehydratase [Acidobacteriota bacterium]